MLHAPVVLAAAVIAGALVGTGAAASQAGAVRATLRAPANPRALAVLVGTMRGQKLSWRLTHHGLGSSARSAQLRLAGRSVRLCAPCANAVSGSVTLSPAGARAARSGSAAVDLVGRSAVIHGKLALGTVPTLQLIGMSDGAVLTLPWTVHFAVTGVALGSGTKLVADNGEGDSAPVQVQTKTATGADSAVGTFTIADDKKLSGRRDLSFSLTDSSGKALGNVEATVKVYNVLLAGRR